MLQFSKRQMHRVGTRKMDAFREQLDGWLGSEHAGWADLDDPTRQDALHDMISEAERAGMTVETDYAVFCRVLLDVPGANLRDPCAPLFRPDIAEVLETDWKPAAKLVRMERLLATEMETAQ